MLGHAELQQLTERLRGGAADASAALTAWLGRPTQISVERVEQLPLAEATGVLGPSEEPICFCAMGVRGPIRGQLVLAFDDASGLALADLLLGRPLGTSRGWGEVEQSAALETANIIGCAYLNAMAPGQPAGGPADEPAWVPTPPRFARDYPAALLEFALMDQALAHEQLFLTRTQFRVGDAPLDWSLLFIPDGASLDALRGVLLPGGADDAR